MFRLKTNYYRQKTTDKYRLQTENHRQYTDYRQKTTDNIQTSGRKPQTNTDFKQKTTDNIQTTDRRQAVHTIYDDFSNGLGIFQIECYTMFIKKSIKYNENKKTNKLY